MVFASTFWFADVAFITGMGGALLYDKVTKSRLVDQLAIGLFYETLVLKGKATPQQIKRTVTGKIPSWIQMLITALVQFAAVWTILTNIFSESAARSVFVTALHIMYAYTIDGATKDIILDEDRSAWTPLQKARHILIPLNLEPTKVFSADLNQTARNTQMIKAHQDLRRDAKYTLPSILVTLSLYKVFSSMYVFFLVCPALLFTHNKINQNLNTVYDMLCLTFLRNRCDNLFGDYKGIVMKDEKHDYHGRQYQYFNYSFKPLESIAYSKFFKYARNKKKASVAEAKVAYYLGRGAMVVAAFMVLDLLNLRNLDFISEDFPHVVKVLGGMLPYAVYYGVHAAVAYRNHSMSDWYDNPLKRGLALLGESVLSGYLFYKPLLEMVSRSWTS